MSGVSGSSPVGKHIYANLYGIDRELLFNEASLVRAIENTLRDEGIEPVEIKSWSFGGRKGGVSVIVLLEGAHLVIHTWAEYRYATLDVLVTGDYDPEKIFKKIVEILKPQSYRVGFTYRGEFLGERR
ncbi:MAG: adenosylmethionine decarboxylase [Sulfolobales archaeon]|nr:adenosylmethionine decarboxylase [Sulfolobales archaeon]MDW8082860.1 adenosylmethionine decarboxylase [Sulfolobales archaeon]